MLAHLTSANNEHLLLKQIRHLEMQILEKVNGSETATFKFTQSELETSKLSSQIEHLQQQINAINKVQSQ